MHSISTRRRAVRRTMVARHNIHYFSQIAGEHEFFREFSESRPLYPR
jgi:hypothetical protein